MILIVIIVLIILLIVLTGYLLPVKHRASTEVLVNSNSENVWKRITNYQEFPSWRTDIKQVKSINETSWIEVTKNDDELPLTMIRREENQKLITQIDSKDLPFGGNWEFHLKADGERTIVTITENGEVYNPVFRFVSKFIMGHDSNIKTYASDLEKSFK